tara:strand:+ start:287 stop:655 length:369 start_codon:yes stop_codon:yes gene_type:complete
MGLARVLAHLDLLADDEHFLHSELHASLVLMDCLLEGAIYMLFLECLYENRDGWHKLRLLLHALVEDFCLLQDMSDSLRAGPLSQAELRLQRHAVVRSALHEFSGQPCFEHGRCSMLSRAVL